jgi:hypothetical protein
MRIWKSDLLHWTKRQGGKESNDGVCKAGRIWGSNDVWSVEGNTQKCWQGNLATVTHEGTCKGHIYSVVSINQWWHFKNHMKPEAQRIWWMPSKKWCSDSFLFHYDWNCVVSFWNALPLFIILANFILSSRSHPDIHNIFLSCMSWFSLSSHCFQLFQVST